MENKKTEVNSASSSITSQLFGSETSSSSNDIFASIFSPKGVGRNSVSSEVRGSWRQKEHSGNHLWNAKQDNTYKHVEASYGRKERSSTTYQQNGADPCNFSSSVYYGGQDIYSKSPTSTSYPYKKDGGEDDPSGASRGNWWEGSLYY